MLGTILLIPALLSSTTTAGDPLRDKLILAQATAKAVAPGTVLLDIDKSTFKASCNLIPKLTQKVGPFGAAAFVIVHGWGSGNWKAGGPPAHISLDLTLGGQFVSSSLSAKRDQPSDSARTSVSYSFILYKGHSAQLAMATEVSGTGDLSGCSSKLAVRALSVAGTGVPQ